MSAAANFYLWAEGKETGPVARREMEAMWKEGTFPRGALWKRAGDATYTDPSELDQEFAPVLPKPTAAKDSAVKVAITAEQHLATVRKASQYKTLRVVVWAITALLEIVGTTAAWKTVELAPKLGLEHSQQTLVVVFGVIGGLVWMLLIAALHQLMLLAVDAVDLLIDQGRHRRAEE